MSGTTFDSITKTTSSASPRAQVILGDPTGCESYEYDATSLLHRLAPVAPPLPQADKVPPEKKKGDPGLEPAPRRFVPPRLPASAHQGQNLNCRAPPIFASLILVKAQYEPTKGEVRAFFE